MPAIDPVRQNERQGNENFPTDELNSLRGTSSPTEATPASPWIVELGHELRTPLNSIVGTTQLALAEELSPIMREYLKAIQASADELIEVCNDIAGFDRLVHNRSTLHKKFDLREMVTTICQGVVQNTAFGNITLNFEFEDDVPDALVGDLSRFRQVLGNSLRHVVVANASQVCVSMKATPMDSLQEQVRVHLSVERTSDQPGTTCVAPAQNSRRLLAAKVLTHFMGGELSLKETAESATLMLNLPFRYREDQAMQQADTHVPKASLTILIAEDVSANQAVATRLLESEGHQGVVANSGSEAIELLQSGHFDAVIMDVQMPVLDGYATARTIRELESSSSRARIPIIGLTAHTTQVVRDKCLQAGMDDYLPKPLDLSQLLATLGRLRNARAF